MGFTVYSSTDSGAPSLTGLTGSLLSVLDAILVDGYGSKIAAGWTRPFPATSSYGTYKLGNGTTASLFVYDAGSGSQAGAEALMTGWNSIDSIEGGRVTGSNPYPAYANLNIGFGRVGNYGAVVLRKSTATTAVARSWIAFADSASLYFFTKPADPATFANNRWSAFFFGDMYSFRSGSADIGRCMIIGRVNPSSSAVADDRMDVINQVGGGIATPVTGHFAAHLCAGGSGSITLCKTGDSSKAVNSPVLTGTVPFLNPCDNGLYISPVWLVDAGFANVRGKLRGFWHVLHASGSLADGAVITGSSDFPNRTFQVVASSANAAMYLIETSDTLDTNYP